MRWVIPLCIALGAAGGGAAVLARAYVRLTEDAPVRHPSRGVYDPPTANDLAPTSAGAAHGDAVATGTPTAGEGVAAPGSPSLAQGLEEAQRAARVASPGQVRGAGTALPAAAGLAADPRGQGVEMTDDEARLGAQVQDLAQKMAPALAKEALEYGAQKPPEAAEVEHDLMETWKEQRQILAGQRDTVDSVVQGAR